MTSLSNTARTNAVNTVFANSRTCLAVSVVAAIALGVLSWHAMPVYAAAVIIAGVTIASVLTSLRFYSPWFSWAAWFVPFLLFAVVVEPVRIGVISIVTVVYAYSLAAVLVFGVFVVAREQLQKWVANGAF